MRLYFINTITSLDEANLEEKRMVSNYMKVIEYNTIKFKIIYGITEFNAKNVCFICMKRETKYENNNRKQTLDFVVI